jgi:hypothetical protein
MKKVILEIEDSAFESFMGMIGLCPQVSVVNVCQIKDVQKSTDYYVALAMRALENMVAFRTPGDYGYLMVALNEGVVKGLPFFYTPKDFLDYMKELGFKNLPSRSTLYNTIGKVAGKYPDWIFTDAPKASEALRRKNLVKLFLSAYMKALSGKLDGSLDVF